jgi:hypothetical protein
MVSSPCIVVFTPDCDGILSVHKRCALFAKSFEASVLLESLTAGLVMRESSMVGSLMIDVSSVDPGRLAQGKLVDFRFISPKLRPLRFALIFVPCIAMWDRFVK